MRWIALGAVLVAILGAAVAFTVWSGREIAPPPTPVEPERVAVPARPVRPPVELPPPDPFVARPPPAAVAPTPVAAQPAPAVADPTPPTLEMPEELDAPPGPPIRADQGSVRTLLEAKMPALKVCYAGWKQRSPDLQLNVGLTLNIDLIPGTELARVRHVSADREGRGRIGMEQCVARVLRSTTFEVPAHAGNVTITVPLDFGGR